MGKTKLTIGQSVGCNRKLLQSLEIRKKLHEPRKHTDKIDNLKLLFGDFMNYFQ